MNEQGPDIAHQVSGLVDISIVQVYFVILELHTVLVTSVNTM